MGDPDGEFPAVVPIIDPDFERKGAGVSFGFAVEFVGRNSDSNADLALDDLNAARAKAKGSADAGEVEGTIITCKSSGAEEERWAATSFQPMLPPA
ncbi:MAG: hypothetical protein QM796_19310 [Chthoniobacteraceae bacterium]